MKVIQVLRYPNRKYYIRGMGKYSNLKDLLDHIDEGCVLKVTDVRSGADLTYHTIKQITAQKIIPNINQDNLLQFIREQRQEMRGRDV